MDDPDFHAGVGRDLDQFAFYRQFRMAVCAAAGVVRDVDPGKDTLAGLDFCRAELRKVQDYPEPLGGIVVDTEGVAVIIQFDGISGE